MSMRDSAPVLDARALAPSDAAAIRAWCEREPSGYVWFGEGPRASSAERLSWYMAARHATQRAAEAECWRRGTTIRSLWDFRLDVIGPNGGRAGAAPGLRPEWCARAPIAYIDALNASGCAWRIAAWLDGVWWATTPRDAAVYTQPVLARGMPNIEVVGVLSTLWEDSCRAWLIEQAAAFARTVQADALLVGVKPWLRFGMVPATAGNGLLMYQDCVQPTPYAPGVWEYAMSAGIVDLAAQVPVLTLTRRPTPPEMMGIGGTAVEAVTAEAALISL